MKMDLSKSENRIGVSEQGKTIYVYNNMGVMKQSIWFLSTYIFFRFYGRDRGYSIQTSSKVVKVFKI